MKNTFSAQRWFNWFNRPPRALGAFCHRPPQASSAPCPRREGGRCPGCARQLPRLLSHWAPRDKGYPLPACHQRPGMDTRGIDYTSPFHTLGHVQSLELTTDISKASSLNISNCREKNKSGLLPGASSSTDVVFIVLLQCCSELCFINTYIEKTQRNLWVRLYYFSLLWFLNTK